MVFACCAFARSGFQLLFDPWFYPDSFDWLANGLAYSGKVVQAFPISHRGMFLTLLGALSFHWDFAQCLLYLGLLSHCLTAITIFFLLRSILIETTSLLASLLFLFLANPLGQSAFLGADVPANFLLATSLFCWFDYFRLERRALIYYVALIAAVGFHLQYIGVILAPTYLLFADLQILKKNRRDIFKAILLFAVVAAIFFIPRLIKFGVFYTEDVQHLSLVKLLYSGGLNYYLVALPSVFPWPLLILALMGVVFSSNKISKFCLVWFLNIFLFFALFYSWTESRFLIYATVPVCVLAALGAEKGFEFIRSPTLRACFVILLLLGVNSTLTTYPFDLEISLHPKKTFIRSAAGHWEQQTALVKPYLISHWIEAKTMRAQFNSAEIDTHYASKPAQALLEKLHDKLRAELKDQKIYYFEPLWPDEWYFIKNRNLLYLRSDIHTFGAREELDQFSKNSERFVLVTTTAFSPLPKNSLIIAQVGQYVAWSVSKSLNK